VQPGPFNAGRLRKFRRGARPAEPEPQRPTPTRRRIASCGSDGRGRRLWARSEIAHRV